MKLNKYLYNSALVVLSLYFSTPFSFCMHENEIEEELTSLTSTAPRVFETPKEAIEYSSRLFNLCNEKKYEEALKDAYPEPVIAMQSQSAEEKRVVTNFTIGDLEQYHFFRLCALAMISLNKGENEQLNTEKAIQHYKESLTYINKYLSSPIFGPPFVSQVPSVRNNMNNHRIVAYRKKSEATSGWAHLLMKQSMSDLDKLLYKKLLLSSIDSLKETINRIEISPLLNQELLNIKFNLFKEYINLINVCDQEEGEAVLKKAKEIHREFRNKKATLYQAQTGRALELINKNREYNALSEAKSGSKKVKQLMQKKKIDYKGDLERMITEININANDPTQTPLQTKIIENQQILRLRAQSNLADPSILSLLKENEKQIREALLASHSSANLLDIYKKYEDFLGGNLLQNDMTLYTLSAYLHSGDTEGALEHITVLAQLEQKKYGSSSLLTRYFQAAIKNLNGDHEEWEALEQEIIQRAQKEREKKENKKKRRQQQHVELIKEKQKTLLALEEVKRSKEKNKTIPQEYLALEELSDVSASKTSVDQQIVSFSLQEQKEEKKKRHEEMERQRENQRNISSSSHTSEKKKLQETAPTMVSPSSIQNTLLNIKDLCVLKGVAKDVDEEIENKSWNFTREHLRMYFEALGCINKEGGKHKKVSLPNAVIVTYKGSTITILNELGGALTLPRWDGSKDNGTVPLYLRKQILKAREKLARHLTRGIEEARKKERDSLPLLR